MNKNTDHHKRMRAMLAKLNEKQIFRAALKAGANGQGISDAMKSFFPK